MILCLLDDFVLPVSLGANQWYFVLPVHFVCPLLWAYSIVLTKIPELAQRKLVK